MPRALTFNLLAAFFGDRLVGVAVFYVLAGTKLSRKGVLCGMYVTPEARGSGLAAALVETLAILAACVGAPPCFVSSMIVKLSEKRPGQP